MTQETHQFDADVAQLIQLVTHSIYSNKDIFLRELISNANDACQKARMLSLQDTAYLGDESDLGIHLAIDQDKKTLTITDTGIGMSRDEVIEHIGTIAKSGTKTFMENMKKAAKKKKEDKENDSNSDLIGQFGIGFYSAFMVAKKVVLETKANGHDAVHRTSTGDGNYVLEESKKTTRGTTITLHLHDEEEHHIYADHTKIRQLIKQHSNYVPVPITMYKQEE
jgi:molecular chaperone HtpG